MPFLKTGLERYKRYKQLRLCIISQKVDLFSLYFKFEDKVDCEDKVSFYDDIFNYGGKSLVLQFTYFTLILHLLYYSFLFQSFPPLLLSVLIKYGSRSGRKIYLTWEHGNWPVQQIEIDIFLVISRRRWTPIFSLSLTSDSVSSTENK